MEEGSSSKSEPLGRQPEARPNVDAALGAIIAPLTGADSRATCPGIEDPLGDYSEQTGAFFG
jgi:hypothetical protein